MGVMPPLLAASLWTSLLILLMVALSVRVMLGRRRHRISMGDGADGQLQALTRSFGNAAEYIPVGVGALILLALVQTPTLWIHVIGAMLFVGRLVHPIGLTMRPPNAPRVLGMALTWLALIIAAVLLLVASLALVQA